MTRCLNYFKVCGHVQQWKFAQLHNILPKVRLKFYQILNKPSKICPRLLKLCQSAEIFPNLVTLAAGELRGLIYFYHLAVPGSNSKHTIFASSIYSQILFYTCHCVDKSWTGNLSRNLSAWAHLAIFLVPCGFAFQFSLWKLLKTSDKQLGLTPDFSGVVGLNLAWSLPVAVVRLDVGDLNAVGWGEGPRALVTPIKAIRVGVGVYNKKLGLS